MELNQARINELGRRLKREDLLNRHRERTREEYRTIFGTKTTPESGREHLDLIFSRVIQARANPLSETRYRELADANVLSEALEQDTHEEAFSVLYETEDIGQKIANELLRHVVDLFGVNDEWRSELDVALDTNVVQAFVKTGGIELPEEELGRDASDVVNMNPTATPRKKISYQAVQDAFNEAATSQGFAPIVFDELWLEHREFIADPLLHDRSVFGDFLEE